MAEYELTGQIEELLGQRVKGNGINGMFFCPLHENTRTPAFSIHLDEGLWYCFGCGRKGNLEQLYHQLGEELDDDKKYELLAKSVYREPEEERNFATLANKLRRQLAGPKGQAAWRLYADSRHIRLDAEQKFQVGYEPQRHALAFPYWDDNGRVTGIKYRHSDGSKTSESGGKRSIYNVTDIIGAPVILLAEGESDAMVAWTKCGDRLAVCGSPGAGVSERTWANWGVDFLFARRIYVAFDADEAGDAGAETAMRVLGMERSVRVRPTRGKDLVEHIQKGGSLGELVDEADSNV